ncbi:MAG TPA: ABC transporter permease [Dehalococcoidia bacterium]|nr:ABC transporter permease [Dehalococcoidia bacterium]
MRKIFTRKRSSPSVHVHWGNFKFAVFYAFKQVIKGNRWALTLLILVMAFSFVNLVFVSALISGVMTTLDNQMINTQFGNIVIGPTTDKYFIEKGNALLNKIDMVDGVAGVAVHLNYSAFFEYKWKEKESVNDKGKSGTWPVIGVDPVQEARVTSIHECIINGRYLKDNDRDKIVLGVEIAGGKVSQSSEFLTLGGVNIGDKVRLTYPNGVQREYEVAGIFYAREMMRTDHMAYVTRKEMASVLDSRIYSDRASEILVKVEPGVDEAALIDKLKNMGVIAVIKPWTEYGSAAQSVVSTFEIIGSLIGSFGLFVSAAVMFIIIYINVLNRKRQIGIMRAIGIPQSAIVVAYILQAVFFVVTGIFIGWLIMNFVIEPYFAYFPIDMPMGFLSLTIKFTTSIVSAVALLVAGVLAGLIPSVTVMRDNIIHIIWGN